MNINQQIKTLEGALNRKGTLYTVELSNVGNPDYRQNSKMALPDTTCGWAHVDTIEAASDICRLYVSFYDLGSGNWSGGKVVRNDGLVMGRIMYNGHFWNDAKIQSDRKEMEAVCASL